MAKTTFVDGSSTLWADFVNSIYNTGGGHKHDGGSDDGSAGKIDPETEIEWGTHAAAPSKTADSASAVEWSFAHAAAGVFRFLFDELKVSRIMPVSGDTVSFADSTGLNFKDVWADYFVGVSGLKVQGGPVLKKVNSTSAKLWNSAESATAELTADLVGDVTGSISGGTVSGSSVAASGTVSGVVGSFTSCNADTVNADDAVVTNDVSIGGLGINDRIPWVVAKISGTTVQKDSSGLVSSVTNGSTGVYLVNFSSAVSDANVPVVVSPSHTAFRSLRWEWVTTTQLRVTSEDNSATPQNLGGFTVCVWDF